MFWSFLKRTESVEYVMLTILDYILGRSVRFGMIGLKKCRLIFVLNSRITSLHEAMRLYTFLFSPNSQPQEQRICLEISPGKYFHWCSKNFPFPCRQINVESRGGGEEWGRINTLIIDEGSETDDKRLHIFARLWVLSHFRAQMSSSLGSQFFPWKKKLAISERGEETERKMFGENFQFVSWFTGFPSPWQSKCDEKVTPLDLDPI